jgi:serine/threonine protein kinase
VYRAHDANLDRDVAIKVLPQLFAADPERVARFDREARVLASLNHPNIAAIYGLERTSTATFLVMELVPGKTLAARIARGRVPVDEALPIATQIASALEAAHEKGIVHRDLKPANTVASPDGKVKVLDFGLAKAFTAEAPAIDVTHSPTIPYAGTMAGVFLGTPAYMSPEQTRGKNVDKRTDIWAFGCVLYEMLAGRPAFCGDTLTDIVAAVVTKEPDWSALPFDTPPSVGSVLVRCLRKDPAHRLRDIGDARIEIQETPAESGTPTLASRPPLGGGRSERSRLVLRSWVSRFSPP